MRSHALLRSLGHRGSTRDCARVERLVCASKHVCVQSTRRFSAATGTESQSLHPRRVARTRSLKSPPATRAQSTKARPWIKAHVALGSNLGERLQWIEDACEALSNHDSIRLLRTSLLYETAPMYVTDQDAFLNAACEIETTLGPMDLLDELQRIERDMGRVKTIDKGPRNIDLDILLYEGETLNTDRLIIPHKLMHEREFVLRPLADLIPEEPIPSQHPTKSIRSYLDKLTPADPPLSPIVPFGPDLYLRPLDPHRKTKLMSIFNVTPDSFSDGGELLPKDRQEVLRQANYDISSKSNDIVTARESLLQNDYLRQLYRAMVTSINSGADIIDIGGQSSRPGAPSVSAEEEQDRVHPAMAIRALFFPSIAASVDTYRAEVAAASIDYGHQYPATDNGIPHTIEPGAHVVNDISAGLLDPNMLSVAAKQRATVVLMHMRGTPETMTQPEYLKYPNGVVAGVAEELKERVAAAEAAGIPRWRIVLDPGIGFAKTAEQNYELLRGLQQLRDWGGLRGIPWLVGTSRKRFIGETLGKDDDLLKSREAKLRGELVTTKQTRTTGSGPSTADSEVAINEKGNPSQEDLQVIADLKTKINNLHELEQRTKRVHRSMDKTKDGARAFSTKLKDIKRQQIELQQELNEKEKSLNGQQQGEGTKQSYSHEQQMQGPGSSVESEWSQATELSHRRTEEQRRSDPDKEPRLRHASKRDMGTAATIVAAVQGGADVIRVHNVGVARDVIAVADAIWRR